MNKIILGHDKSDYALSVSLQHELSNEVKLSVNFNLEHGKRLGIFGPSGSGKTSLLRILSGLTTSASGSITYRGDIWAKDSKPNGEHNRQIAYTPQGAPLIPSLTVSQHLHFAAKRAWQNKIHNLLPRLVDVLELTPLLERLPNKLSGGERQRVSLSCALLQQAPLLLLDEPFSALDANLKAQAKKLVSDVQHTLGSELIIVSHSLSELLALTDMALVIQKGKQQDFGAVSSIFANLKSDDSNSNQFLQGKVVNFKDAYGNLCERSIGVWALLETELGELTVPIEDHDIGKKCIFSLSPDDIIITDKSLTTSAVNSYEGRIEYLERDYTSGISTLKVRVKEYLLYVRVPSQTLTRILIGIGKDVEVHLLKIKII
ncbi:ATP-binding cassette domain-containing protein [Pseudoalteromonas gelatinilytica]